MRGSIRKRGKDSWTIIYDAQRHENGSRNQKWETVRGTKKHAEDVLTERLGSVTRGTYVDPNVITVSQFLKDWLGHIKLHVARSTYEGYAWIVRKHLAPALGRHKLQTLKAVHIQKYYDIARTGGVGVQTIIHNHRVLRRALGDAVKWQMIYANPAALATPPKLIKPEINWLDTETIPKILESARDTTKRTDYYIPILLALATGMRRSEVLALRWEDVDLTECTVKVSRAVAHVRGGEVIYKETKTDRSMRTIYISPSVAETLKAHRKAQMQEGADSGLICTQRNGAPILPSAFTHATKKILAKAGVEGIRLHDFRHTQVALMRLAGADIKVISERLGHSNISTTMDIYGHAIPKLDQEAAGKMDNVFRLERPEKEATG